SIDGCTRPPPTARRAADLGDALGRRELARQFRARPGIFGTSRVSSVLAPLALRPNIARPPLARLRAVGRGNLPIRGRRQSAAALSACHGRLWLKGHPSL